MSYGIPYKGSKNAIAKKIVDLLPSGNCLIDMFAGGCAITHCAIESGKWDRYIINDINPLPTQLFVDGINGKYNDEKRWVSREEFHRLKDTDPFVKYCWSFGNDGRSYLYSKEIENTKREWHYAAIKSDTHSYSGKLENLERLNRVQNLENLERLNRVQNLERLNRVQNLERLVTDYRNVQIPDGAVVYCDIPYVGTNAEYVKGFDANAFFEWAAKHPCYISAYTAPFKCIAEIPRFSKVSTVGRATVIEKVFYTGA